MVAPMNRTNTAKLVKEEHLPSMDGTATMTGGGEFQRRYRNDYSKKSHADYEAAQKEMMALSPDVSPVRILGAVREI